MTATNLTVQIPAATGDFYLQIAGSDTVSREGVLFKEGISNPTSAPVVIGFDQLSPRGTLPASLRAYVNAMSTNQTQSKDSIYQASDAAWPLLTLPTNLVATPDIADTGVVLSWEQAGSSLTADYDVEVRDTNSNLVQPVTVTPQTAPEGQRIVQLSSAEFTPGLLITMAVRAHPPTTAAAGTITIFTVPVSYCGGVDIIP